MFFFSRANHASANLKKVLSWKTLQVYFISPSVETWHIFRNMLGQFIFSWADILSEKNPYFGKHLFFGKQRLITRTIFVCKTSRLVTISILINGLNKIVLHFFSGKLFYKSNRKLFSCVCIAWYKHSRGWENSRRLRKTETKSRVCISVSNSPILGDPGAVGRAGRKGAQKFSSTLSSRLLTRPDWQPLGLRGWNSPNPSRVYIRLCKHGKRFLLLKSIPQGNVWRSVSRICKWIVGLKGIIQARIHTGFHRFTSLRTADVSPRLSPLRNVSRGGTSFLLAKRPSAAISEKKRLSFAGYRFTEIGQIFHNKYTLL